MVRQLITVIVSAAAIAIGATGQRSLGAQSGEALTGTVNSQEEGKMEGVVVTARGDGANFAVSVVSDANGRYTFPRTHVPAGKYTVRIRAAGYDLTSGSTVEVAAGKAAT